MERKWDCEDLQEDASGYSSTVINGDHYGENAVKEEDDLCVLKREISCHALYESLVHSHLECLKIGCNLDNIHMSVVDAMASDDQNHLEMSHQSELDQFMETYCMALSKLKESMEEPQQESIAFINYIYSQLNEVISPPTK